VPLLLFFDIHINVCVCPSIRLFGPPAFDLLVAIIRSRNGNKTAKPNDRKSNLKIVNTNLNLFLDPVAIGFSL